MRWLTRPTANAVGGSTSSITNVSSQSSQASQQSRTTITAESFTRSVITLVAALDTWVASKVNLEIRLPAA